MELNDRKPNNEERKLIEFLVDKSLLEIKPANWIDNLYVRPMDDGNMGSLYLLPNAITNKNRKFGSQIYEQQFIDNDGILIVVSLNLDENGDLYELDIWKTDFSPIIKYPQPI